MDKVKPTGTKARHKRESIKREAEHGEEVQDKAA
jgi:hypothetical protein